LRHGATDVEVPGIFAGIRDNPRGVDIFSHWKKIFITTNGLAAA